MVTERIEAPSELRFLGFCFVAAVGSLFAVMTLQINAWLMFPLAILVLALLSFADGYWQKRS